MLTFETPTQRGWGAEGMRISGIAHLYLVRLKSRAALMQEIFAVLGISVGVALLFASQIASTSLNGSVAQLATGVLGNATYEIKSRSPAGLEQGMLGRVQRLAGVTGAVPVLEVSGELAGPRGRVPVDLIATNPQFVKRSVGPLLRHFNARQLARQQALAVPTPIMRRIGVGPLETIEIEVGGRLTRALVGAELGEQSIGPLVNAPVILAPLAYAQSLARTPGHITRIFVDVSPGDRRRVHRELTRLAAGRLNVAPAAFDAKLFDQAAGPINQSTITFAAICALVGFMFAYCSMLLSVEMRSALVRELRRCGATRWETVRTLLFDALVLGTIASLIGLALGDLLSIVVFGTNAGYLSFAFPVGSQRIVTWQAVAVSVAVAMLAAGVGVLTPMREIWSRARSRPPTQRRMTPDLWTSLALACGIACLAGTTAILAFAPQSAIPGVVLLLIALVLLLPPLVDAATVAFAWLQRNVGAAATEIAVAELHAGGNRTRSLAIAATGAIAVFGGVSIQASHANLEGGLERLVRQLSQAADVWVLAPGQQNTLATTPLTTHDQAKIAALPGVRAVGRYRAAFLEYGSRRVWVLAPPTVAPAPIPPSQLNGGRIRQVTARLRTGGWATLSQALASERHLRVGQHFTLPAARPITLRLAGTTTNLGWPPGAVILNGQDFARAWGSSAPTAYDVMLTPGASPATAVREIRHVLGSATALTVETEQQREQTQIAISHQGLGRLTQIAILVLMAGVLATVSSMGAAIWQRRRRFARMKVHGLDTVTLWAALVWESALLLGAGCLAGALFGIYGQILLSHALQSVTGFPVIISLGIPLALGSFAMVTVVAAAMIGIPGYRAASVAPNPHL